MLPTALFRLPWFIKCWLKNKYTIIRPLTVNEIMLAKSVFGDLIDYNKVRIVNYPYLPWQSDEIFIAPNGYIFAFGKNYQDDYADDELYKAKPYFRQVFIHEMTHVFQYQQGVNVLWRGALLQSAYYLSFFRYNPYRYEFKKDKHFWHYNIEQQGCICEDIYLKKIPNVVCEKPN